MSLIQSLLIGLIAGYSVQAQTQTNPTGCDITTPGCVATENASTPDLFPTTVKDVPAQKVEPAQVSNPAVTQTKPQESNISRPVISQPKSQVSDYGVPNMGQGEPVVPRAGTTIPEAQQKLRAYKNLSDFEYKANFNKSDGSDVDGVIKSNSDQSSLHEIKKDGAYSIHETRKLDSEEKTEDSHRTNKYSYSNYVKVGNQSGYEGPNQVDDEEDGLNYRNAYSANRFQGANQQFGYQFQHNQQEQRKQSHINYQQKQNENSIYHVRQRQQQGSNYHHQIQSQIQSHNQQKLIRLIGYQPQPDEADEEEDNHNSQYLIHYGYNPNQVYVPGSHQGHYNPHGQKPVQIYAPDFGLMKNHEKDLIELYTTIAQRYVYLSETNQSVRPIVEFVNNNKLQPEMSYLIINKMNEAFKQSNIKIQWTEMNLISQQVEAIKYKKIDDMVRGFFINFKQYTPKFVELYNLKFRELFKYQGLTPIDLTSIRNFYLLVAPSAKPEDIENTIKRVFIYIAQQNGIKHQLSLNFDPIDKPAYIQNPVIYVAIPGQDDLLNLNENQYKNQLELAIRKILNQQESTEAKKNTVYGIYQKTDSAFSNELDTLQNFFKELESNQNDYHKFIKFTNDCRNNGKSNLLAKILPQTANEGNLDLNTYHRVIRELPQIKEKEVNNLEESFKKFASVFESTTKRNGFEQISRKVQNELSASTAQGSFSSKFESSMNRSIQFSF